MVFWYALLYVCWASLQEAKWMLLKIKAFTQAEISCTKVKFAKPCRLWEWEYSELVEYGTSGGVQIFLCYGGVCDLGVCVCSELMYRLCFSFTHARTHIFNGIEYTVTFSVLLVAIPPTHPPFFAFNRLYS